MAASVSAQFNAGLEVTEVVAYGLDNVPDPSSVHSFGPDNATLTATSTPAVTKVFSDTIALAAGAGTLDLTSLAGPASTTVDFTGLKVQIVKLKTPASNSGSIIVEHKDAATGYNLFGDDNNSDESIEVPPGTVLIFIYNEALADVGANAKDLKFAGTGTDGMQIMLVAG